MLAVFSPFVLVVPDGNTAAPCSSEVLLLQTVPWQEGWAVWHRFLRCQQKTAGSVCKGFYAEKSCSAVCHFSFRPLGTERLLLWGVCWGRKQQHLKQVQSLCVTVKYSEKYVLFMQ